jgi:hypothetical protein
MAFVCYCLLANVTRSIIMFVGFLVYYSELFSQISFFVEYSFLKASFSFQFIPWNKYISVWILSNIDYVRWLIRFLINSIKLTCFYLLRVKCYNFGRCPDRYEGFHLSYKVSKDITILWVLQY